MKKNPVVEISCFTCRKQKLDRSVYDPRCKHREGSWHSFELGEIVDAPCRDWALGKVKITALLEAAQQSMHATLAEAHVCNCPAKDVLHYKTCPCANMPSA